MSTFGKTSRQKIQRAKVKRKRTRGATNMAASLLAHVASNKDKGKDNATPTSPQKQQSRENNLEGVMSFLFESAYQIVTWVLIALAVGFILLFFSKENWRGVLWSSCALFCFVAIMLCLLAQRHFQIFQPSSVARASITAKRPTFQQRGDLMTVTFGTSTTTQKTADLEKAPHSIANIGGYEPLKMYVENKTLYLDTALYVPGNVKPFEIKHNNYDVIPPGYDLNSNDVALELVNEHHIPIFQIVYQSPTHIIVKGMFASPNGGVLIVDDEGTQLGSIRRPTYTLKQIFKYPSWQHPSEYNDLINPTISN